MKNQNAGETKRAARVAGLLYILQIPLGVFGIMYAQKEIIVTGSFDETLNNILHHEFLFRLSIVSAILTAIVTVFTALLLFKVLSRVNKDQARLIVMFAAVAAPITMLNELNHIAVLLIAKTSDRSSHQMETMFWLFLDLHKYGIHISGLFWGLWLLPMGYLVFRSDYIPKIIGVLLIIGGFGYLGDFVTFFLWPDLKLIVSEFTFVGEVVMVLWLLIKGIQVNRYPTLSTGKN